jgi:hypothetical protein
METHQNTAFDTPQNCASLLSSTKSGLRFADAGTSPFTISKRITCDASVICISDFNFLHSMNLFLPAALSSAKSLPSSPVNTSPAGPPPPRRRRTPGCAARRPCSAGRLSGRGAQLREQVCRDVLHLLVGLDCYAGGSRELGGWGEGSARRAGTYDDNSEADAWLERGWMFRVRDESRKTCVSLGRGSGRAGLAAGQIRREVFCAGR